MKKFEEIPISTRTIIVSTNIEINIEEMYKNLPITSYKVIEKRRGRKKKNYVEHIQNNVEDGSIISVKYQGNIRGVELKKRKKSSKYFRNAVTIIISVNNKLINLKISINNGTRMRKNLCLIGMNLKDLRENIGRKPLEFIELKINY